MAVLGLTREVGAQYDYGPEEIGAEESPFPDPDTSSGDESRDELEEVEEMDGTKPTAAAEAPEGKRKGRGCEVDPSSSTPSRTPIGALLLGLGFIAVRSQLKK